MDNLIKAVMRKKGELNLSTKDLAENTGVSQWTLSALFRGKRIRIYKSTEKKLNDWLYTKIWGD